MAKANVIQTDFLAGEVTPRLETQDNTEGRKHGVELMQNWEVTLQGSAETSPGFKWVAGINSGAARIVPFIITEYLSFALVITPYETLLYDSAGPVETPNIFTDEYFLLPWYYEDSGGIGWDGYGDGTGRVEFLYGAVKLAQGSGDRATDVARVTQGISGLSGHSHRIKVNVARLTGEYSILIGETAGDAQLGEYTFDTIGVQEIDGIVTPVAPGDMYITIQAKGAGSSLVVASAHIYDETAGGITDVKWNATPWLNIGEIDRIQHVRYPEDLSAGTYLLRYSMLIASPQRPIYKMSHSVLSGAFSLSALSLTGTPVQWSAGGYPSTLAFFGNRMWASGCSKVPNTFWASKVGEFDNFTLGTNDDDAISANIIKGGAVKWISGGLGLLIGTENAEYVVSAISGVITPSDIHVRIQSTNGSAARQPFEVGNQVVYLSVDRRRLYRIEYEWTKEAWRSRDVLYSADHLTRGNRQLNHVAYAASPSSRIVGVTDDGEVVQATYDVFSGNIGWFRRITQGDILSAAVMTFLGSSELWALVDREASATSIELERAPLEQSVKMDSYERFVSETPVSFVSVYHLLNQTCQVLIDGEIHPDVIPSPPFGAVTLEFSGTDIYVGLQVDSILRSLPVEGTMPGAGSTRPMKKRLVEIGLKILDSFRPKVNGRRVSDITDEEERTEVLKVTNTIWGDEVQVTLRQDLPRHTEVAGWFAKIQREET